MIIAVGSSSGIGIEILKDILKFDNVIAIYFSKKIKKKKFSSSRYKLFIEKVDITKEKEIIKFVKKYQKYMTKITCLNLAALTLDKLTLNIRPSDLNKTFQVNVFSNIFFAKHLLPIMMNQNYGRFIHFSSTKATNGDVGILGYSASKSSLVGISNCLSKEYGRYGITSNILSLGYFNTNLWTRLSKKKRDSLLNQVPLKKLGNIKNISTTIKNIIKSDYINGSFIKIDGGL